MTVMLRTRHTLKDSREDFKKDVLNKSKNSNFLW
jgi:hypothetical protein